MIDAINKWETSIHPDYSDAYYVMNTPMIDDYLTQEDLDWYRNPDKFKSLQVSWDVVSMLPRLHNIEILPLLNELYQYSNIPPIRKMRALVSYKSWVFLFFKCYPYLLSAWDRHLEFFKHKRNSISKDKFQSLVAGFSQMVWDWANNKEGIRWPIVALTVIESKAFPREPSAVYYFME